MNRSQTNDWIPVWLVLEAENGFVVMGYDGRQIDDENWTINVRGRGCHTKAITVVPNKVVYRTREAAEGRKRELEQDST